MYVEKQKEALIFSFLEPERQWRGNNRRASRPLAAKSIGAHGAKIVFYDNLMWRPHENATFLFFKLQRP